MITEQLAELLGAEQVAGDAETLAAHRFDRWCLKHWQDWRGESLDAPACVVTPRNTADVQAVVRFASKHGVRARSMGIRQRGVWRRGAAPLIRL
jgi:alkyldihydroxyacetonephosphate synthase